MPDEKVVRAYELQEGDRVAYFGNEYQIKKQEEKFELRGKRIHGGSIKKHYIGLKSQEKILLICRKKS